MNAAVITPAMRTALLAHDSDGRFFASSDTVRKLRTFGLCEPRRLRLTSQGLHWAVALAGQDGS